jgi:hypothetical protein
MKSTVLFLVVFLTAGVGWSQERRVPDEILRELNYMVGTWKAEGKVGEIAVQGKWSTRWAPGKHCLMRESSVDIEGVMVTGIGVIGWDPAAERITEQVFFDNNDAALLKWKVLPSGEWEGTLTATQLGQPIERTVKLIKKGSGEMVYLEAASENEESRIILRKVTNGEPRAETVDAPRPIIAADKTEVPRDAIAEMAFLVGDWEVQGTFNGELLPNGTYSATWAPGNYSLLLRSSWGTDAVGIGGWSPSRKQYVEYWYISDGSTRTFRYSLDKDKNVWAGTWTEVDSQGREGAGGISLHKKDREFGVIATGASPDGKPLEVKITNLKK